MKTRVPSAAPNVALATHARSVCPDDNILARVIEGGLGADERASLERHLDVCPACLALVAGAAAPPLERTAEGLGPPQERLAFGARVGRYVLREPIGAGAMGRVYVAHDPTLDRKVALKLLHRSVVEPSLEARLLREAKAMARLAHHPDVITVYDAGTHESRVFIAMEFVEGGTLREWLASRRRPWKETIGIFLRAGRGLAHAHAAGLIHRDFKPDNVLVGSDGRVRVTDFGLARTTRDAHESASGWEHAPLDASLTRTGTLVGTPAYMSPEQLNGEPADARSDIFSFCVALYEGLYGARPFHGSNVAQLREATSRDRLAAPRSRSVPRRVWRAVAGGLRARPDDRHASMATLLESLERAARPAPLRLVGGAFAAVVVASGVLLVSRGGASETPRQAAPVTTSLPPAPRVPPAFDPAPPETSAASFGPPAPPAFAVPSAPPKRPPRVRAPARASAPATIPAAPSVDVAPAAPVVFGNNSAPIVR